MQRDRAWDRLRHGVGPPLLYAFAALFSFPAFGLLVFGEHGLAYAHDVFDDAAGLVRLATAGDLLGHGLSLWDPYLTAGNAYLVQSSVPPIAPDALLALAIGPFATFTLVSWAFAFSAGLSMHLFLRDSLRLATPAVVAGGLMFAFSFVHYVFGAGIALIPLLPWLSDKASIPGPRRWLVVLGWIGVAALMLYQGLSQTTLFAAGLQLAWILLTAPRGKHVGRAVMWIGVWALALGLFAPVLVSQLAALPSSQRQIWVLPTYTFGEALWTAVKHYGSILIDIPNALRLGQTEPRYGMLFLGAIGLPLLLIGVLWGRRGRRWRALIVLLVAIPILDIAGMLVVPIQDGFGPFATFQFWRVRHEMSFVLVAIAAIGADVVVGWVERRKGPTESRRLRLASIGVIAIVGLLMIELLIAARPVVRALRSLESPSTRSIGWLLAASAISIGILVIGGAALAAWRARGGRLSSTRLRRGLLLCALAVFFVERGAWGQADLLLNAHQGIYGDPYVNSFAASLGATSGITYLLAQPDIAASRVLTFGDHPSRMAYHGLRQADGYQSIYPLVYHELFDRVIAPQLATSEKRRRYYEQWGSRAYTFGPNVDPELVRLIGARWLYVRGDEVPTVESAVERFRDGNVTVYEVPDAFPRAFLTAGLRTAGDRRTVLDELAAADLPTLRGSAFATTSEAQAARLPSAGVSGTAGSASIVMDQPDVIEVDVDATGPATLVLTDVMAPGWRAEVDGQPASIATVDGAFRGVAVTSSTERVVFRYRQVATEAGFAIAFGSGIVAIVWCLALRRRDRRWGALRSGAAPVAGP